MTPDQPALSAEDFLPIMLNQVPYVGRLGIEIVAWERGRVVMRLPPAEEILRPGGTVCGPAMFALADIALYGMVLSIIGRVELAVTTDMTLHFLRRPKLVGLIGEAKCLKLGAKLAIGDITIWAEGEGPDRAVAHAVGTYALPPPSA